MTLRSRGRRLAVPAMALVAVLAAALGVAQILDPAAPDPGAAVRPVGSDAFGIRELRPSLPGATSWVARWESPRSFSGLDPSDPWFDADHGSATYVAEGGELTISGRAPRMYVHDPGLQQQWGDVEITMYFKRVADSGIPYAGFTAVARSNHLTTQDGSAGRCDTRGYGARLRFDGDTDFEKETAHPRNQSTSTRTAFPAGMPFGRWLGVKYLVYDWADGVHLELWLDRSGGRDGGQWELVNEVVDSGELFGAVPCAPGIDPAMPLTGATSREGSESGRPNLSVFFRSDGIAPGGLVYKWGSIREILA